jgi:hypothetical protein
MESAPVHEMIPEMHDNGDPENLSTNVYIFSKPGSYYLAYVADAGQTIEIDLAGESPFQMDVIDTWNMKVMDQATIDPGLFKFTTELPYTAIKITKN